jgi:hypothetical protein
MGYFKELPNLQVVNRTKNQISSDEVVVIKNIFKRPKIREDFLSVVSAFEYYSILENERPEQIAEKIYGDPELDWVILIANNITNINDQWPMTLDSFNNYMLDKYGSEERFYQIRHYETLSVTDSFNREVFPGGLIVDQAFYNAPEFESMEEIPPGITFPPIIISGTQATAVANVGAGNTIESISITNGGLGYKTPPRVYISPPPTTSNASASCLINNFRVSSIVGLVSGQGYNSAPLVTITAPPEPIQATAECELGEDFYYDKVFSITNLQGGAGYGLTAPIITFSPPPNILQGSYLNQSSGSIGSQVEGIYIREDGYRLYSANIFGSNQIREYKFLDSWNVGTVVFERDLDVSADFSYCTGVEFKPDGTVMYVTGGQSGSYKLVAYDLSTAWNISTAIKWNEISTTNPGGLRFKPDGTILYFLEADNPDVIKQYPLSTAWDVTTRSSFNAQYNITNPTGDNGILGFTFLSDGTKMFACGQNNSSIFEFNLGTAWDISTLELSLSYYVGDKIINPVDVYIRGDKEKFVTGGGVDDKIYEYNIISLAKGYSRVTNGSVSLIEITQAGAGYTEAPTVTIGTPYLSVTATGIANLTAGIVTGITFTNTGFGYTEAPSITIEEAPISKQAIAISKLSNDTSLDSIQIIDGGLNYVNEIVISFDSPNDIQNVDVGDTYAQDQRLWKWYGTEWKEKITEEFTYLDPSTNSLVRIPGNSMSIPVTYYEYESRINEKKRDILILRPQYLSAVITDLKNMMKYDPEIKDYIRDNLKSTYNPKMVGS